MSSSFRWTQVPLELLRVLVERSDVSGEEAASELSMLYGTPPRAGFVGDRWAVLRDAWLVAGDDPKSADAIVALRLAGIGDPAIATTTPGGTAAYLASCPDSVRLRSAVLRAFLALGSTGPHDPTTGAATAPGGAVVPVADDAAVGEDAAVGDGADGAPPAEVIVHARSADELRDAVIVALGSLVGGGADGAGEVVVDDDGDIPIRWGSAVLYVRVLDGNPVIRIFSPILREVQLRDELRDAVNELNKDHLFVSTFWADGVVLLTADLYAAPFVAQQFLNLLHAVAETADSLDDQLRSRFAGDATAGPGTAGYL